MRRVFLLLASVLTALALSSGIALAEIKIGTDASEILTGTNSADHITGKGGNDTLKGLAGSDVYYFTNGWGQDTLEERATYRVGTKTLAGGSDTLSFSQVTTPVTVRLSRQWGPDMNVASTSDSITGLQRVSLGSSIVENATGGLGSDQIYGGGERNTLQPGGGGNDTLRDFGGCPGSCVGSGTALPVSNDVFKGFGSNTGSDSAWDWGGTADVANLNPFSASEVYVNAVDFDGNTTTESLQIVTSPTTQVIIVGHFGEYLNWTRSYNQQGRIESLVFSDGTFSGAGDVAGATTASMSTENNTSTDSKTVQGLMSASKERATKTSKGTELERAAKKLLEQAKKEIGKNPSPVPAEGS